jgi:hypothetical protein
MKLGAGGPAAWFVVGLGCSVLIFGTFSRGAASNNRKITYDKKMS